MTEPCPAAPRRPKRWWLTDDGTDAKARELGLEAPPGASYEDLRQKLFAEIERRKQGNGEAPPEEAKAKVEIPAPMPLPELPAVPSFPIEILPDALQAWVADAAERAQFPADYAAVVAMVALGSVFGRKLGIRPKRHDDWMEHGNLWGALVGLPSALKSPAMREAMRPLKALQIAANADHEQLQAGHKARVQAYRLACEAIKKMAAKELAKDLKATVNLSPEQEEPEEPICRTYWTSNVNEASLGVLLQQNPDGLLIERDELSSLLMRLEDEGCADLRGMLLSGWSGNEGYRFDRIVRGKVAIQKYAVSVIGGIQPGPLSRYVRSAYRGERADGLLQRFQLAVWPDCGPFEHVDRRPKLDARNAAAAVFARADTFDPLAIGAKDDYGDAPPFVRLSDEAQEVFDSWYVAFMRNRRAVEAAGGESGPLCAHLGKFPGLVAKLALDIHVADHPTTKRVSERAILKALGWIEYLTPHARRLYHAVEYPETGAAKLLLARLHAGDLPDRAFGARDIYRKAWHGLTEPATVKKACQLLHDYGWLIEIDPGGSTGGRPADPLYAVSPAVEVAS